MYAKIHKTGSVTVYRDDLDFSQFGKREKGAITTYDEFLTNIYYLTELNSINLFSLDGYGNILISININGEIKAFYITPEDFNRYSHSGRVLLMAEELDRYFDDDEIQQIFEG